jgi:hypothetical protein
MNMMRRNENEWLADAVLWYTSRNISRDYVRLYDKCCVVGRAHHEPRHARQQNKEQLK